MTIVVFSAVGAGLTGVTDGSGDWGDFNGDGMLDLILTGEDDSESKSATIVQNFAVLQFTSIDPESGSPGTEVTLNGAGFGSSTGDITVTFTPSGGGTGTDVTPTTITGAGTQMTVSVPMALTAGDYDVSITRETDNSMKTQSSAFSVLPVYIVTNTNDSGSGSLRNAIDQANADGVESTIEFDISGTTPHTIAPNSALPALNEAVTINGTSEPDYTDSPVIELDGQNTSNTSGLDVKTSNSVIRGLFVINYYIGINLYDTHDNNENITIEKNYVGLKADGTTKAGNTNHGINIRAFEKCTVKENVISGNTNNGIHAVENSGITIRYWNWL